MSNLATEDMDRLTEIASFRNTESTGAINRDFAKRIIATHNGLAILHERHDEICREWESACERERAANHLLAEKTAECDTIRRDAQAATAREAVERALQAAWNDVCTDSGCHPDCFTRKGKRLVANFARGGTFTQLVAEYLNVSAGGAGSGPEEHGETVQSKCSCRERAVAVMDVERAWMNPPDDVNKNEYVYSAPDVRKLFDEILDAIDKGSQGRFPNLRAAFPISDEKERSEAMIALEGDSHVSAGGSARLIDEDRHGAPAHYNHDEVCAWIRGYNQAAAELLAASQGEAERGDFKAHVVRVIGDAMGELKMMRDSSAGSMFEQFAAYAIWLRKLIGDAPEGSHPDEWLPRHATWHGERANWQGEVERLRAHAASQGEAEQGGSKVLDAINWLMGCGDDFEEPEVPDNTRPRRYWWRPVFAQKAGLVYDAAKFEYTLPRSAGEGTPSPSEIPTDPKLGVGGTDFTWEVAFKKLADSCYKHFGHLPGDYDHILADARKNALLEGVQHTQEGRR